MRCIVAKEDIVAGLQKAAGIIPARSGAAYLRNIWLRAENDVLNVMATDAHIEFIGRYAATSPYDGLVGVQGKNFVDLVRQLPGGQFELAVDKESGNLLLEQGRRKYKLPIVDADWFQEFSEFPKTDTIVWSADYLLELVDRVGFCVSAGDDAEALGCLYMRGDVPPKKKGEKRTGRISCCALNGHQFALMEFVDDELLSVLPKGGLLIHGRYLRELKRWLSGQDEIVLAISEKRLFLCSMDAGDASVLGGEMFSLPLSTYLFPDYMSFMSKLSEEGVSTLEVDSKEFLDALGRLSIFTTDSARMVTLGLAESELALVASGQDVGEADERLDVSYQGDLVKIAFPVRNLMEILGHFASGRVTLTFTGVDGPCGIRGKDDPDYTVIIMPLRATDDAYYEEPDK